MKEKIGFQDECCITLRDEDGNVKDSRNHKKLFNKIIDTLLNALEGKKNA